MALKYNGVDGGHGGIRWYNPSDGKVIQKFLDDYGLDHSVGELEFSRQVIKTKPRGMILHPDHVPSPETEGSFYMNGICSDKDLRITFATGMRDKIVISKNIVDFLFCSTNQSFTSCFGLHNGDEQLRRFQKTKGYYICYITDGDGEYEYKGKKYIHPKMQGRAWLFESGCCTHYTVGRPYGKTGYELREALRKWLPNGLEIGWKLTSDFLALNGAQYDNFDREKTIHDSYDKTFNSEKLYDDNKIKIRYV